jgi:hypothetical protein
MTQLWRGAANALSGAGCGKKRHLFAINNSSLGSKLFDLGCFLL